MASAKAMLFLPYGNFQGALYQPLLPWKLRFRHERATHKFPWSRHPYPEPMSSYDVISELKREHKQKVQYRELLDWENASRAWTHPEEACVFGYVRVSHPKSAASGLSFAVQIDEILGYYVQRFNAEPVKLGPIFCDSVVSGRSTSLRARCGGRDLMSCTKANDHIMFYRLDRGMRSVKDAAILWNDHWKPNNITPHFLDIRADLTTPTGKTMFYLSTVLAENESDIKSERAKSVSAWLKKKGRPVNRFAGYGWKLAENDKGKYRIVDMAERAIMHEVARMRDCETPTPTFRSIARIVDKKIRDYEGKGPPKSRRVCHQASVCHRTTKYYYAWHALIDAGHQKAVCDGPCCKKAPVLTYLPDAPAEVAGPTLKRARRVPSSE